MDSGPRPGHSLFTGCLIDGLTGGVPPVTQRNGRSVIIGSELGRYVRHRVATYEGRPGWRQTPDLGAFDFDERGEMLIPVLIGDSPDATAPAMARGSGEQIAAGADTVLPSVAAEGRVVDAEREIDSAANPTVAAATIRDGAAAGVAEIEAAAIDAIATDAAAIEVAALAAMTIPSFRLAASSPPASKPAAGTSEPAPAAPATERGRRPVVVAVAGACAVAVAAIVGLLWRDAADSTPGVSPSPTPDVRVAAPTSLLASRTQPLVTDSPASRPPAGAAATPPSAMSPGASPPSAGSAAPQPPAAPAASELPAPSPAVTNPGGAASPAASPRKPASAVTVQRSGSAAASPTVARPRVASLFASAQATSICPTWIESSRGAEVSWNGKFAAVPIELPLPCGVEVTLGVRQAHHLDATRKVTARPGGKPVSVRLTRGYLVRFTSTPPGAMVVRSTPSGRRAAARPDEQLGVTPATAMLASEASTVTFRLDGYQAVTRQVKPLDDSSEVHVALVPIAPGAQ